MSIKKSASRDLSFVGLDVHKDSITSAVLEPGREVPIVDRFFHDEASILRFVTNFENRAQLRTCYEAGPTGYELARLLQRLGVACEVTASSLIPVAPGAKVKTNSRDAQRLAHLYRVGELVAVHIPTPQEEAIRDLARQRAVLDPIEAHLRAVEDDLVPYFSDGPFAEAVGQLSAYRAVTETGALVLSAEVCDWRRFPPATTLMGFCGLVPSEYSSGERTSRGRITKAGNTHLRVQLVGSAWAYQHRPAVGPLMKKRQARCSEETVARAWRAQLHLCGKFRRLAARKTSSKTVATAIARELAGFLWGEIAA